MKLTDKEVKMFEFLSKIHVTAWADKWGWTHHNINDVILSTNGIAWTAYNKADHSIRLQKVIQEYLK